MRALIRVRVELAMHDAATGAHALHLTRHDIAGVAQRIFVRNRAFEHVGDDLHVFVTMHTKALARRDVVVINHPKRPKVNVLRVLIFSK